MRTRTKSIFSNDAKFSIDALAAVLVWSLKFMERAKKQKGAKKRAT